MNDIPLLLQWLKQHAPGLYRQFNNVQPTMPQGIQLPIQQRMLLERLLLDRELQRSMDARKRANDIFDIQQQDRFNQPGMQWDHLQNFPYVGKFM